MDCDLIYTYHKLATDIALQDGQAVRGADVLAEGALGVSRDGHGRSGEGEDGGEELHFEMCGLKRGCCCEFGF